MIESIKNLGEIQQYQQNKIVVFKARNDIIS